MTAKTTPEVPSDRNASPGAITPSPQAAAALSPAPPATTGVPSIPQLAAISPRSVPETSLPSTSRGIWSLFRPQAPSNSSDQQRCATSIHRVPAPSDISAQNSPVTRRRMKSFGSRILFILEKSSGSCRCIQTAFGAVKPGMTAFPPISRKAGNSASSSSASAALRVSFHRIAGRKTLSLASSATRPCIWPDSPIPCTFAICAG